MGLMALVLELLGMMVQKLEQSELWSLVLELGMGSGVELEQSELWSLMLELEKLEKLKVWSLLAFTKSSDLLRKDGTLIERNESIITFFLYIAATNRSLVWEHNDCILICNIRTQSADRTAAFWRNFLTS